MQIEKAESGLGEVLIEVWLVMSASMCSSPKYFGVDFAVSITTAEFYSLSRSVLRCA